MKKLVFLLLVLQSLIAFSQFNKCKEDLFPVRHPEKKMFGYVNIFGEWKIRPYYDLARSFKEGLAVVSRKRHFGLISCEGKVILPIDYDEIKDFVNGFAWVKKSDLWGLVDYDGKIILECKYQEVVDVSRFDDYAWIKTNDVWGLFDKEKVKFIHEPQFDKYQQLSSQFSLVDKNGKKGMIAHAKTDLVLNTEYDAIDKFAPYLLAVQKNGKYGVVRDNGKRLLETKYDAVKNMNLAKFSVKQGDKFAVYDVWGKQYIPFLLDSVGSFNNNAAVVKLDGAYGFINHKGKRILGKYQMATTFKSRIALVKKEDKFQLITRKGVSLGEKYDEVKLFEDYYAGFNGSSWQVFLYTDPTKPSFDFLQVYGGLPSRIRVKHKNGTQFYSAYSSSYTSNIIYDQIEEWEGHYAKVKHHGSLGLIDSSLKEVLAPKYKKVGVEEYLKLTYLKAIDENGKSMLFNAKGKQILTMPYDKIDFAGRNKFIISNEGKYAVMTHKEDVLIDFKYDELISPDKLSDKYSWPLIVMSKGKYGLINKDASFVVKPKSEGCKYLGAGYFELKTKGVQTFVNQKGVEVEKKTVDRKLKLLSNKK